jgi:NAD(P)-dependent dehydrogenase (short-subunit alcohol dehydrogenase family)
LEEETMSGISYGLEEKVVIVTGGSRGIGLELARHFLAAGARVVICGRKEVNLAAAVENLGGGEQLLAVPAHVAREGDVENLFDTAIRQFGSLDVLINNVGMNLLTTSVIDTDLAVWNKIIEGNLTGAFLCSRKAARIMREKKQGKIVNISSLAGTKASPGMGIYGVAKAGLEMLTKVLAFELAPFNIQVNAIAPGVVRTDFSKPFWSTPALCDQIVKAVPASRIAEIIDLVPIVLLLASAQSDYITGQTLLVDGGASVI